METDSPFDKNERQSDKNERARLTPAQLVETVRAVLSAVRNGVKPVAVVVNNNQPGAQHIIETAPNATLDVGMALYAAPLPESRTLSGETPRTDAAEKECSCTVNGAIVSGVVTSAFARQLERELTEARATAARHAAELMRQAAPSSTPRIVGWRHRSRNAEGNEPEWFDWHYQEKEPRGPASDTFEYEPMYAAPVSATDAPKVNPIPMLKKFKDQRDDVADLLRDIVTRHLLPPATDYRARALLETIPTREEQADNLLRGLAELMAEEDTLPTERTPT